MMMKYPDFFIQIYPLYCTTLFCNMFCTITWKKHRIRPSKKNYSLQRTPSLMALFLYEILWNSKQILLLKNVWEKNKKSVWRCPNLNWPFKKSGQNGCPGWPPPTLNLYSNNILEILALRQNGFSFVKLLKTIAGSGGERVWHNAYDKSIHI